MTQTPKRIDVRKSAPAVWALVVVCACALSAAPLNGAEKNQTDEKVIYKRVFENSSPEYIEIQVDRNGRATYDIRSLDDAAEPQPFEVGGPLVAKIYELAKTLNLFRGQDLDVKRRIANLGKKTFRYENAAEAYETSFNYTLDKNATQLMLIFEGLARQQEHLERLQRELKYDRLGLQKAILQFEVDLNRNVLPEPQRLIPVLDQISADTRVVDIARQRARALAERLKLTQ